MRTSTSGRARAAGVLPGLVGLVVLVATACGAATSPATPADRAMEATDTTSAAMPSPENPPTLDPAQRDTAFTKALASRNLEVGDEQTRTAVAESVCQSLASGVTVSALAEQLRAALGGPTPENTGFIIGAATAIYCPDNLPKLKTS